MNEQIKAEFEEWWNKAGFNTQLLHWQGKDHYRDGTVQIAWQSFRAAHARYAGESEAWKPSDKDYDRGIHSNPDGLAWAEFFMQTFPNCGADLDTMHGWFANAMMAMHDHIKNRPAPAVPDAEETVIGKALTAAQKVWDEQPVKKAVVWARNDETGQTLIYTRGEYSDQLLGFVRSLEHRVSPAPAVPDGAVDLLMAAQGAIKLDQLQHADMYIQAVIIALTQATKETDK